MEDRHGPEISLPQPLREDLGEDDAAVVPTGAAEPDRQARLALLDVRGDREIEELLEELDEAVGLRLRR